MDSDNEIDTGYDQPFDANVFGSSRSNRTNAHSRAYSALTASDIANEPYTNQFNSGPHTPTNAIDSPFDNAQNLSFLSSANFSTESLSSSHPAPPPISFAGSLPSSGLGIGTLPSPYSSRRFSGQSLSNSPLLPSSKRNSFNSSNPTTSNTNNNSSSNRAPRPKSAIFMMDSNNFAISEDGSPIQDAIDSTPRARNSFHFGRSTAAQAYVPTPQIAPPTGPSGFTFGGGNASVEIGGSRSNSRSTSPVRSGSPARNGRTASPIRKPTTLGVDKRNTSPTRYQPFNFQPQELMMNGNGSNHSLSVKPAHRKGHKYKHSSVSMNLFQEPPPAIANIHQKVLSIPDSYPIPTFKESIRSVTHTQKLKLAWSIGHVLVSAFVFLVGIKLKMPTLSTLAHLIFYDALGSLVIVFVDIMSNFEVWNSSSIQYPFGLGRLEVLVGFALSTSLIMVGLDLISHSVEEFVIELAVGGEENVKDHSSHHIHGDHSTGTNSSITGNWFVYELVLFISICITIVSSNYILFYDRINNMISNSTRVGGDEPVNDKNSKWKRRSKINVGIIEGVSTTSTENDFVGFARVKNYLNAISRNPTHILTLTYILYLMLAPFLPTQLGLDIDIDLNESTTLVVALLLCYNGWKLAKSLGGILLLSYPHSDYQYYLLKSNIADQIEQLDCFKQTYSLEQLYLAKFNYELIVVGIFILMRGGTSEEESKIRFEINRIIKASVDRSGRKNKIEITIDINRY
ncbi:hypothetical protein CLIB1423_05S03774 [[Candida] railenensis]|uniref:Protein ZRG17 n=1 Tax=[Candida] railenensis TaxID=45579 RepID=A0A9P0QNJ7_9ASCO|nr:hypothetical protein CLIB1423_05S03774 [[Candida] railenensis]